MKMKVVVLPLPKGSHIKVRVDDNYRQLLLANDNHKLETLWWNSALQSAEEKYRLFYHLGKNVFEIFYSQGKNANANKEINQNISKIIRETNYGWNEILKAEQSFNTYRDEILGEALKELKNALKALIVNREKTIDSNEEIISMEEQALIDEFKQSELVKEVEKEFEEYHATVTRKVRAYINRDDHNFERLLENIKYEPKEKI